MPSDIPRPMVQAFAQRMEVALQAGDGEPHTALHARLAALLRAANNVSGAMADATTVGFLGWDGERTLAEAVISACVDVAVRAMWLADDVRPLEVQEAADDDDTMPCGCSRIIRHAMVCGGIKAHANPFVPFTGPWCDCACHRVIEGSVESDE